jgi:hypothetical protein
VSTPIWSSAASAPINWPPGSRDKAWNTVTISGLAMPGTCKVSGIGYKHDIHIKKTPGKNGATITDLGRQPATFTVTCQLACQADLDGFEMTLPLLEPVQSNGSKQELEAVTISHPALAIVGIKSCKVEEISIPHPGSVLGTYEVELKCIEHRPVASMPGTGTATKDVRAWNRRNMPGQNGAGTAPAFVQRVAQQSILPMVNSDP